MTDEGERWKAKYLESIEHQEKLERRWEARLDLLRRGLVRSTLAAEGSDKTVDQCMKEMREVIRSDNMDAGLAGLLPRLEKAVLDSEQRRETRMTQVSEALIALVNQLQDLSLPGEIARPLKALSRKLDAGVSQSRELPPLLGELSGLQGRALSTLQHPQDASRPGLFQRLFGGREAETEHAVAPADRVHAGAQPETESSALVDVDALQPLPEPEVQPAPVDEPLAAGELPSDPVILPQAQPLPEAAPSQPSEAIAPDEAITLAAGEQADGAFALPDAVEPPYSMVARHIEQTLIGLLDDLSLPEPYTAQAQAMRERVSRGLNWYELIPVLDDLAVLMLAITDSGQHEFEAYLQQLNERLDSFQSHLQEASAGHAENSSAARQLDHQLRQQVDGLQSSVQGAADLGSLKRVLEARLAGLLSTMDEHQHERDRREQALADRLQGLAERVASMEHEAHGYREHLEEQRQKALLDPLTGLPNRAAWSERVEQEVKVWQAQGGSLLMAILNLDHFKRINDSYGHLAGDKVLKIVAGQLRKRLRGQDFIARFGGEEFVLLLPQATLETGAKLTQMLRATVETCPFHFKGERVVITVSIGFSAFSPGERAGQVLKRADAALYRAKELGRNRVEHG